MTSLYDRVFLDESRSTRDPAFDTTLDVSPTEKRLEGQRRHKRIRRAEKTALRDQRLMKTRRRGELPTMPGESKSGSRSYGRNPEDSWGLGDGRRHWDARIDRAEDPADARAKRDKLRRK